MLTYYKRTYNISLEKPLPSFFLRPNVGNEAASVEKTGGRKPFGRHAGFAFPEVRALQPIALRFRGRAVFPGIVRFAGGSAASSGAMPSQAPSSFSASSTPECFRLEKSCA